MPSNCETLRLILGDQLSLQMSSLEGCLKTKDVIFMCEVGEEATYVKHHKKKIAFLFSARRHFAEELKADNYTVRYTKFNDPDNAGTFTKELKRAVDELKPQKLVVTAPGEYRVQKMMEQWEYQLGIPVEIFEDTRFYTELDWFDDWIAGYKAPRMENFYQAMRKEHNILMDGDKPVGGQWNYDQENRKPPKDGLKIPSPTTFEPDETTQEVIGLVADNFADHFGDLEPFGFAVTRKQALEVLEVFIEERLKNFGTYQDAMIQGEPWMYHSHISFYLNCGLLLPKECIQAAEKAYYDGEAPLNAVEGFIRQILGWREYVRGIYWHKMPEYAHENYLDAQNKLPWFFWTGETDLNCLKQCITETKQHAYAHHIQRLMVLGNFLLLIGVHPDDVNEWYLIVYADAYEWVEMPNVTGMILHADGGLLGSKPYAAGGNYIHKMSDYCADCKYSVTQKTGEGACPFNYLYWDFIARNEPKLKNNHRMGMMFRTYGKMDDEKKQAIRQSAKVFIESLDIEK